MSVLYVCVCNSKGYCLDLNYDTIPKNKNVLNLSEKINIKCLPVSSDQSLLFSSEIADWNDYDLWKKVVNFAKNCNQNCWPHHDDKR